MTLAHVRALNWAAHGVSDLEPIREVFLESIELLFEENIIHGVGGIDECDGSFVLWVTQNPSCKLVDWGDARTSSDECNVRYDVGSPAEAWECCSKKEFLTRL
jgi:hypothetical protein